MLVANSAVKIKPEMKSYQPYGSAIDIIYNKDDEILVDGPAGTGKSRGILEKILMVAEKYAGARILLVRQTRESMSESVLVTWEEKVLPTGHPAKSDVKRRYRQSYTFPNGSEVVVCGLDKPDKILSTEFDLIFVNEGNEISEENFETLITRLRNGVVPYQQIIIDCNPSHPLHWLWQRYLKGQITRIQSTYADNPVFWNHSAGDWTDIGRKYVIGKLSRLTGTRRKRFFEGIWAASEGLIYEFDPTRHVINYHDIPGLRKNRIPESWPKFWIVDFGFTKPFVWQEWRVSENTGIAYRVREIYYTRRLIHEHSKYLKGLAQREGPPARFICDWDAEGRAQLEQFTGLKTHKAKKDILMGIQAVEKRLEIRQDGQPGLMLVRDALIEVDSELIDAKQPTCTEDEFGYYAWDLTKGKRAKEVPIDDYNHGMDTTRYLFAHLDLGHKRKARAY